MNKIALLFTGQGSQCTGMGKNVYEKFSGSKQIFDEASDILGKDIKKICFEGKSEDLARTENTQIALYTACMAIFNAYEQEVGIRPFCAAGHSLGEYAALTCSGAIEFRDCLKLVQARARYMQEAIDQSRGIMCAIRGISRTIVEDMLKESESKGVVISNYNSPNQVVISGYSDAVEAMGKKLENAGGNVIQLQIKAPFHSPIMQEAADKFKLELGEYTFKEMKWPVISNITAQPYNSSNELKEMLADQIVKPVQWESTMRYMENSSVNIAVEIGPRNILKNLARENCPKLTVYAYDNEKDINEMAGLLEKSHGGRNTGEAKNLFIEKCVANSVCARNRNWDRDQYEEGVIKPYREVKNIYYTLKDSGTEASIEQVKQAYKMLLSVFNTKKVPEGEQKIIIAEIINETNIKSVIDKLD